MDSVTGRPVRTRKANPKYQDDINSINQTISKLERDMHRASLSAVKPVKCATDMPQRSSSIRPDLKSLYKLNRHAAEVEGDGS